MSDTRRACKGMTKKNAACAASPLAPGTVIEGVTVTGNYCRAHDPDLPPSARFGSRAQAIAAGNLGGRPAMPKPSDVARRLIEQNVLALQRPYWRALGYDVRLGPDGPYLVELEDGGAKLYGESKEGDIVVSDAEDLAAMMAAAEKLQDRVYGRPKQQTEISGPEGAPVSTAIVMDPALAAQARDLLRDAAAPRED
jgi:hypothetical protein